MKAPHRATCNVMGKNMLARPCGRSVHNREIVIGMKPSSPDLDSADAVVHEVDLL